MRVSVEINLDRYNSEEIIEMIKQGVVTLQEVEDSGRVSTLFNSDLEEYLWNRRISDLEPTVIDGDIRSAS